MFSAFLITSKMSMAVSRSSFKASMSNLTLWGRSTVDAGYLVDAAVVDEELLTSRWFCIIRLCSRACVARPRPSSSNLAWRSLIPSNSISLRCKNLRDASRSLIRLACLRIIRSVVLSASLRETASSESTFASRKLISLFRWLLHECTYHHPRPVLVLSLSANLS